MNYNCQKVSDNFVFVANVDVPESDEFLLLQNEENISTYTYYLFSEFSFYVLIEEISELGVGATYLKSEYVM